MIKKVYTLGPKFSYSYNLAFAQYKKQEIIPVDSIGEVFGSLDKNSRGIVPIENMLNGSVRETFLSLQKNKVCIFKSYDYKIEHILAGQNKKFETVMSHAQALVQCSDYVNSLRVRGVKVIESPSTSRAMELASENKSIGAIGSREAAEFYNLNILKTKITNKKNNFTRFVEIGTEPCLVTGDKTSLIITPQEDRSGLLFEILSIFKIKDLNLTKIESIPTGKKMNDYIFYMDIESDMKNKKMQEAVKFLRTFVEVDVLGSYKVC